MYLQSHALRRTVKNLCSALRTCLAAKCKDHCRAVITTVPPLPLLFSPRVGREAWAGKAVYHLQTFNKNLLKLHCPRFHVLDLDKVFMSNGVVCEQLFER